MRPLRSLLGAGWLGLVCALAVMSCDEAATVSQTPANRLVTTAWLAEHLADEDLVVVDARPTAQYLAAHVPGAVSASFSEADATSRGRTVSYGGGVDLFLAYDHPRLPFQEGPTAQVEAALRAMGVRKASQVVVYDAGAHFHAARFLFACEYHGFDRVSVLDGGLGKWLADGRETSVEVPVMPPGDVALSGVRPELVATTDDVLLAQADPNAAVVTALSPDWHFGATLPYSVAGHIPAAKMVPMAYFFRDDGTWRSPAQLRALLDVSGVGPGDGVITYCGGNPLSACSYFTLKYVLGQADVRVYAGAYLDWIQDPRDLTVHTWQHPEMLRDSDWIHWWAGDRIQALMLDAPAVVLDVREAAEYADGHVPWSVNLPMSDAAASSAAQWASALGSVGVGNTQEVVVCGEGLSGRVAAAFWLMEYLGHERVSLCAEGMGGWDARWGLTDEETIVGQAEHPLDVAIHPTTFFVTEEAGRRVTGAEDAPIHASFPRVWVFFGDGQPAGLPVDDFAIVPTGAVFTVDGQLRAAGEVWGAFDAAGASYFDEVVCAGATLGDAATCYLALRLLGYPLVRVYVPAGHAL